MNREDLETESHSPLEPAAARIQWSPADYFRRAEWSDIFDRPAPVELDIGCGDGAFLLAMAARHPERNFLGTERMLGRVDKVCRHAARNGLANV
ncbi:MAG TPA: hypothetical protein VGH90_09970, partial [Chthoniobacteraceae bacterium]